MISIRLLLARLAGLLLLGACADPGANLASLPRPPVAASSPVCASTVASDREASFFEGYQRCIMRMPMRDGVELHAFVHAPQKMDGPLPVLLVRTPYSIDVRPGSLSALRYQHWMGALADSGYIFVFQYVRGRLQSEGQFTIVNPPSVDGGVDETTDAYDTAEWLTRNLAQHNGRIGVLGLSYGGWTTVMAMVAPHPAMRAFSPQAAPSDMFIHDDFGHNGALRLASAFGYAALMERGREENPYEFDRRDVYDWYRENDDLQQLDQAILGRQSPSWSAFIANRTYTQYWRSRETTQYLKASPGPVLNVAGWFDAEDFSGAIETYRRLERFDAAAENYLIIGPWTHGGWVREAKRLGPLEFESDTSQRLIATQRRFFDHYLKDVGPRPEAQVEAFETGSNIWRNLPDWPAEPVSATQRLYLRAGGTLMQEPDSVADPGAYDAYVADPKRPVPYAARPFGGFWQDDRAGELWMVEDQRFADGRSDVLTYISEPLSDDVVISGEINVQLHASISGEDADWVVKLIDVLPDGREPEAVSMAGQQNTSDLRGYQLMIASEIFPARFRDGFDKARKVTPWAVIAYRFSLRSRRHSFRAGHRIMVQIQSSWFPLFESNRQGAPLSEGPARKGEHRIYRALPHASFVELPVIAVTE